MVKKQLIMENALELFALQGFEATSIQQITDKCGISKGAFYLSFKSKDALILALIEQFLSGITADIERLVNSNEHTEQLLYNYCKFTFQSYKKHAHFTQLFIKEHHSNLHPEVFNKLMHYSNIINQSVRILVTKQFPHIEKWMLSDIVFDIQALIRGYGELFLHDNSDVEIDLICNAIVEKVTILIKHMKTTVIPAGWLHAPPLATKLSKDQLIAFLQQVQTEVSNEISQQSIALLCKHVEHPSLPLAIEQGLLNNLRAHAHSKWVAYIYELSDKS